MGFFDPFGMVADVGELKNDLSSIKSDVETHTNNNDIHVTASDKSNWDNKLDKNQGTENSGKVLGTNANGEVIPLNGYGFEYDEETKMLKYGTDPTSNLNQGIGLDDTLSKRGYAADAGAVGELKEDLDDLSNSVINNYELISFAELASQERFYYSYENASGKWVGWASSSNYTAHIYDVSNYNGQNLYVSFETINRANIEGHILVYDKPVDSVFYGEYCETDKATIYKNVKIYIPDGATRIAINSKPNTDVVVSYARDMKVTNILSQQFGGVVNISAFDSSSSDKEKSQFVCTGSHDELVLQRAIDELPRGGEIVLANGTYNIDGFAIVEDTYKVAFGIRGNEQRDIIIRGTNQPTRKINSTVFTNTAIINITQDALNCITGTESRVSIIGYDGLETLYTYS